MTDAPAISRAPPARPSQDFSVLREAALAQIQNLARDSWTDHNHHDPGITMMESFCYAMTELGLKLDLGIADLIASGADREAPALPAAETVLPCAPVTARDLERQLLDHYLVADARVSPGATDEIAYYHDPTGTPPISYAPPPGVAARRITPAGLFDVRLTFRDPALNANTYSLIVMAGGNAIGLEIALPHWDEPEAVSFRDGQVMLNNVTMLTPATPWQHLDENHAYFGRATITFTTPAGPGIAEVWLVMRIVSGPDLPALALPAILNAARTAVESTGAGSLVRTFLDRVAAASAAARSVELDLRSWRNLTEAPVAIAVSRVQNIAVNARVEIARTTGLEELLAEILHDIDRCLAQPNHFVDPSELRAVGLANDEILDGPLLTHGSLAGPRDEALVRGDTVFVSDILNLLMRPRSDAETSAGPENPLGRDVVAVTELSLSNFINNRAITKGATECLRLVDIDRHQPRLSVPNCRIVLVRDDVEIPYDRTRVEALVIDARAAAEAAARLPEYDAAPPVPTGTAYAIGDYYPFQYDLPAIYGVTEAGLPPDASVERRQQARQLRAFLMLMEQILSDATEQLASINSLFSPRAAQRTTYFTRPMFEFPDMEHLVRRDHSVAWAAFLADPENTYVQALRTSAEDSEMAVDRRNRMLDHLLARHSEEMVTWGQEAHRWGQRALLGSTLSPATLPQRIAARRLAVNTALVSDKAAYLADVSRLHGLRLQAFGDPAHWDAELINISGGNGQYRWSIVANAAPVLEGTTPAPTQGEAAARARQALRLSGRAGFFGAQDFGGASNRRFVLRSGMSATDPVIARGLTGFPTLAQANAAAAPVRAALRTRIRRDSRTAMERRIDHQTGLRLTHRRRLLVPLGDAFEIIDAAPAPPFVKVWRFWSRASFTGTILLESAVQFSDPAEPAAISAATADVEQMLLFGLDVWNYRVQETVPGSFQLTLVDMDNVVLARAPTPFASDAAAQTGRDRIIARLYELYSGEGFHPVETLLLRPRSPGDPFLSLPGTDGAMLDDPYSHRIVFVLPSGYSRDFGDATAEPQPARPHRFRDAEFRRHAERMIRRSCPAHILPEIRWVDREVNGSVASDASFDSFETRYFTWLDIMVMPGASNAVETAARTGLISTLNAVMAG